MTVYLWDASNHDDPIRVRDGIDGYTHKVAEGHPFFYRDAEYKASLNNARNLGIPILGGYFVNHPGTQADQADWFVECLDQDTPWWREHPCFVLQIDAEKFDYMSRAPNLAEIQAFGDRLVQVHGVDPRRVLAYAPQWLYGNTLNGLTYRLWASGYGTNPVAHYRDAYPGDASKRWAAYSGQTPLILQYGSNTTIGDQATCDANAYRGTLEELLAELGGGEAPMTPEEMQTLAQMTAAEVWKMAFKSADQPNTNNTMMGDLLLSTNIHTMAVFNETAGLKASLDDIEGAIADLEPGTGGIAEHRHEGFATGGVLPAQDA